MQPKQCAAQEVKSCVGTQVLVLPAVAGKAAMKYSAAVGPGNSEEHGADRFFRRAAVRACYAGYAEAPGA